MLVSAVRALSSFWRTLSISIPAALALAACAEPFDVWTGVAREPGFEGVLLRVALPDFTEALELRTADGQRPVTCERSGSDARTCLAIVDLAPSTLEGGDLCSAALGCTRLRPPRARVPTPDVRAARVDVSSGKLVLGWDRSPKASEFRVEAWDRTGLLERSVGTATQAELAIGRPANDSSLSASVTAVQQDGDTLGSAAAFVLPSIGFRAGAAWQLLTADDFEAGTLVLDDASLGPDHRWLLLVLNADGPEALDVRVEPLGPSTTASLRAAPVFLGGVGSSSPPAGSISDEAVRRTRLERLAIERGDPNATAVVGRAAAGPGRAEFCVLEGLDPERPVRRSAIEVARTASAVVYVDAAERAQYPASAFRQLAEAWEERISPRLEAVLGAVSDRDHDGRVKILLSGAIGSAHGGYFNPRDLTSDADHSADCRNGASNGGEVLYLNSLANSAPSDAEMISDWYPSTLAHELTHLLHFARRCLERECAGPEEPWIAEGLARIGEDVAGYGWHLSGWRSVAGQYLQSEHRRRSLTVWEGDSAGNYAQVHAFFRYWADREGPSFLKALIRSRTVGVGNVERALRMPFARAFAEWVTALAVSNEPWSPSLRFDYAGDAWAPLHQRVGSLAPLTLEPGGLALSLRTNGFAAVSAPAGVNRVRLRTPGPAPLVVVIRVPASSAALAEGTLEAATPAR